MGVQDAHTLPCTMMRRRTYAELRTCLWHVALTYSAARSAPFYR